MAKGAVAHVAVADELAAFQFEVAKRSELLLGALGESQGRNDHEPNDRNACPGFHSRTILYDTGF